MFCCHIVPDQPPQEVNISIVSSRSLRFVWIPPLPENQNGIIISYNISLTTVDTNMTEYYSTSDVNISITDLLPFTTYTFVVAARTVVGIGPFSSPFIITTNQDGKH